MTGSDFISVPRLVDYINAELSELYDLLVGSYEDYFYDTIDVNLVNGTESYTLPADLYKVRKVFFKEGTDRYVMRRMALDEIGLYPSDSRPARTHYKYRVMGQNLIVFPLPGTGTLELWYIPNYTPLVNDGDTLALSVPVQGWDDFIVSGAAARCLVKEESDPSALLMAKEQARVRIIKAAADRDAGEPEAVIDVSERFTNKRWW
jgi:hypothetical protein